MKGSELEDEETQEEELKMSGKVSERKEQEPSRDPEEEQFEHEGPFKKCVTMLGEKWIPIEYN